MAAQAGAAALRYLRKGLKLIPFLRPRNPPDRPPALSTWLDILVPRIEIGPVKINGLSAVILSAAAAWVIIKNPELFFSTTFGVARGAFQALDQGSVRLYFPENMDVDALRGADRRAASEYLSLALGYDVAVYFQPFDVTDEDLNSPTLITLPYPSDPFWKHESLEEFLLSPTSLLRIPEARLQAGLDSNSNSGWIFLPLMIVNTISVIVQHKNQVSDSALKTWVQTILSKARIRDNTSPDPFQFWPFANQLGIGDELEEFVAEREEDFIILGLVGQFRTRILALYSPTHSSRNVVEQDNEISHLRDEVRALAVLIQRAEKEPRRLAEDRELEERARAIAGVWPSTDDDE